MSSATAGSAGGAEDTSGETRSSSVGRQADPGLGADGAGQLVGHEATSVRPWGSTRRTSSPASQPNVTAW